MSNPDTNNDDMQHMVKTICRIYGYEPSFDQRTGKYVLSPEEPDTSTGDLFDGIDMSTKN